MKNIVIIALVAFGAYSLYQHFNFAKVGPDDEIIMYSLSYCKYCKQLSNELSDAGIEFVEYYVDKDKEKSKELTQKLIDHKVPGGGIKMPVVDLGVAILPNRPSLSEIESHL